jgi:hypothetical protein
MPGAPNRPPEKPPEVPVAPPVPESTQQKVLRRLVPSRVALLLDVWKGSPSPELLGPYEKAEAAYAQADYSNALSALELLSIRFAEPRWPTLPEPFRRLRVPIPTPMPPHWDPDHALSPAEREARRSRRSAEDQVALVDGALAWGSTHGVATADLTTALAEARTILSTEGASAGFFERLDAIWTGLAGRLPAPKGTGPRAAAPAPPAPEAGEA